MIEKIAYPYLVRFCAVIVWKISVLFQEIPKFRPLGSELDFRCLTLFALCSAIGCISTSSLVEMAVDSTLVVEFVLRCFAANTCGEISPFIQWKRVYAISKESVVDIADLQQNLSIIFRWHCSAMDAIKEPAMTFAL